MKLSIITTVYKAEKDLPRLLDSMLAQKSHELEFFLIDNGSPDHCGEIIAEYAKRDPRFSVLSLKENIGYIGARNLGLHSCDGHYVGFCDSDDFLQPGAYDRVVKKIHETDCDLYITSYRTHNGNLIVENKLPFDVGVFDKNKIESSILPNAFGPFGGRPALRGFMWKEVFRRSLICENAFLFDESLKPYEDQIFNIDVIKQCNCIYIDDNPIYNYIVNSESITAKMVSSFDFVAEYFLLRNLYEAKKNRANSVSHVRALNTQTLESFYSMFLYESKMKNKNTFDSVSTIKKNIDSRWVQNVLKNANALSYRTKIVKFALRFGLYGTLLNLMKIAGT